MKRADLTQVLSQALPLALADLHRDVELGEVVDVTFPESLPGALRRDLTTGAGFNERTEGYERLLTLADTVGPNMSLLICGLNPSINAAEAGVGFARPGNRFWPAAMAAQLVEADRDARAALSDHGIGMTDLVKRATRQAAELAAGEYRDGLARVERLVGWLEPASICFVGLAGWRAAVDRKATAGPQPDGLGGAPVYVMPSTSGLNAHSSLADLTDHLRAAAAMGA